MSETNKQYDGGVSVGRDVAVGGSVSVGRDMKVAHNLKVEGWLDAKNVKSANKGVFLSADKLSAAYPKPEKGWWALVPDGDKSLVVYVSNGTKWEDSGEIVSVEVDVVSLEEQMSGETQAREEADTALQQADTAETAARKQGDADLLSQIDSTSKTLAEAIANEETERKQGDADLLSQIDSTSKTLAEAIANEEQYRLTQDTALQSQITQNKTDITANAAAISAHEQAYRNLGVYESETAALAALAALAVCADTTLGMAHFAYKADGTTYVSQMWQCLSYDVCRQVIYNRDKFYQRCIEFTSSARTAIKRVPNWDIAFCDRLVWDANANKYVPSMYGTKGTASINDAIPLATASRDGLMPRGYVTKVDNAAADILNIYEVYDGVLSRLADLEEKLAALTVGAETEAAAE